MGKITYYSILLILLGCSSFVSSQDISPSYLTFYDSFGRMYELHTASSTIREEYQIENSPTIIIVATHSTYQKQFVEQMKAIININSEEYQYIYVIANSEDEDNSGYFTTKTVASNFLSGKQFKIIIHDQCGKPIKSSYQTINETELKQYLTRLLKQSADNCAR